MERSPNRKIKETHVPHSKKSPRKANLRLTKLRNILQKSRPEFAELVKVPALTIRSYESGVRRLPEHIARRIAYATFVNPSWLLDDGASAENPQSWTGQAYTRAFYSRSGIGFGPPVETDDDFGLAALYMPLSHRVARLWRVALRQRKHILCGHLLKTSIATVATEMGLDEHLQKEIPSALPTCDTSTYLMGGVVTATSSVSDDNPMDTKWMTLLLSTAALFEWSAALEGTQARRDVFLSRLDLVRGLVQRSFEKRPPVNAKQVSAKTKPKAKSVALSS